MLLEVAYITPVTDLLTLHLLIKLQNLVMRHYLVIIKAQKTQSLEAGRARQGNVHLAIVKALSNISLDVSQRHALRLVYGQRPSQGEGDLGSAAHNLTIQAIDVPLLFRNGHCDAVIKLYNRREQSVMRFERDETIIIAREFLEKLGDLFVIEINTFFGKHAILAHFESSLGDFFFGHKLVLLKLLEPLHRREGKADQNARTAVDDACIGVEVLETDDATGFLEFQSAETGDVLEHGADGAGVEDARVDGDGVLGGVANTL